MLNILSNTMAIATRIDRKNAMPSRPRNYVYSIAEKRRMEEVARNIETAKTRRYFG